MCDPEPTRFPIVITDPLATWTAEGQPLTEEVPVVDELDVVPQKLRPAYQDRTRPASQW
jgi:hypothetical protein